MKKKIKDYILVVDAFGIIPVWSLQHPIKEAEDGYLLLPEANTHWMKMLKALAKFQDTFPYPTPDWNFEIYITGEIEYKTVKKTRVITDLKIDKICMESG